MLTTTLLPNANHRALVRAATRLLGSADAEDAVQDAYVRALEADLPELTSAQAWLLTVVRNLAIDRLRRRNWLQQWVLAETESTDISAQMTPSAEMDVALAQQATCALRVLATELAPEDGAAVLLHEVFEVPHAEIAQASGRSEASSRQQLRRAMQRLRKARGVRYDPKPTEYERGEETVLRLYQQSMQLLDPQTLWHMLRQPPISALAQLTTVTALAPSHPRVATSGIIQVGGQLGLLLTLDGITLCVVPLGVRTERLSQHV